MRSPARQSAIRIGLKPEIIPGTGRDEPDQLGGRRALAATDTRRYWLSGKVYGLSWAAHASSGNTVHNPFLLEALLTSSIQAMHTTYSLTLPPNFDPRITATPPPGVRLRLSTR